MSRWTPYRAAVAALIIVWVTVQLAVATAALTVDRPARFGWQMFSGLSSNPSYVLVYADGTEESTTVGRQLDWVRADVAYHEHLPAHLCRTEDGLVEVGIVPRGEDEPDRTVSCDTVGR